MKLPLPKRIQLWCQHHWQRFQQQLAHYNRLIETYRSAWEQTPDHAMAHVHWGVQLATLGELPHALEKFAKAAQLSPNRSEPWTNWGVALAKNGELPAAIEKFRKALELAPQLPVNHVLLGAALLEQNEPEPAEWHYQKAVELNPELAETFVNWGIALARASLYEESAQRFRHAIALQPRQAQVYFLWGAVLAEMQRYEQAIDKFQATLRLNPRHADALYFWSVSLGRLGQYQEAVDKARQATSLAPNRAELYLNLGDALAHLAQFDVAMANYRQALALNPEAPEAYLSLGLALCRLGKHTEGWLMFQKAKLLDPKHPNLHKCWGASLVEMARFEEALPHLRQAADENAQKHLQDSAVLLNLALVLLHLGEREEGLALLHQVESLDASNPDVHFMLGSFYLNTAQLALATQHFEQALQNDTPRYEAVLNKALLQASQGQYEEAIRRVRPLYREKPLKPSVLVIYSLLLAWQGDGWEAQNKLELEAVAHPKMLKLHLALLEVYLENNAYKEALALYHQLPWATLSHFPVQEQWLAVWLGARFMLGQLGAIGAAGAYSETASLLHSPAQPTHLEQEQAASLLEQSLRLKPEVGVAWLLWMRTRLNLLTLLSQKEVSFQVGEAFMEELLLLVKACFSSKSQTEQLLPLMWAWHQQGAALQGLTATLEEQLEFTLGVHVAGQPTHAGIAPCLQWACSF
jgi:tetratricopeptide (TPR) repeat protein